MAMFDGEMIDVTTPDGRSLKMPRALASNFPGLTIAPPPTPPPIQSLGQTTPIPTEIAGPSVIPPAPVAPPPSPVNPASQAPAGTGGVPRFDDLVQPEAPKPAPQPKPVTDADLSKAGVSAGLNEQNAALAQKAEAGKQLADVEAKESLAIADAYHARNEELDRAAAQRVKDAAAWEQKVNTATTEYQSAAKAFADHKVDRSLAHPILAAISVALGGIGSVLKNETQNPALDMVMNRLKENVQLQLADRDKLGQVAGMKRTAIDLVREQSADATTRYNLAMAGMTEKAARQVEELKARSNSDRVKAGADVLAADLRSQGAQYLDAAIGKRLELDQADADRKQRALQHRQSIGVQYAQLKQADRHHQDEMAWNREKAKLEADAAIEAARAKGQGERAKELMELQKLNEERGVGGATGDALLQPEGQKMMQQADQNDALAKTLREQAKAVTDPAKRSKVEEAATLYERGAAELRGEAQLRHTWRLGNTEQAAKVSEMLGATQTALTLIDEIKMLRDKYGAEWFKTEEGRAMQSKGGVLELTVKEAYKLGALDKGSEAYLNKITGGDPSKLSAGDLWGMFGAQGPGANLDALGSALETRAINEVKSKKYRGEIKFNRSQAVTDSPQSKIAKEIEAEKTPLELAKGARNVGGARGVLEDIGSPINAIFGNGFERDSELNARVAENQGTGSGLSDEQGRKVGRLIADYRKGGKDGAEAKRLLVGLATSNREDLAGAALNTLSAEAPDLYQEALKKLPDERRAARQAFDAERVALPTRTLVPPVPRTDATRADARAAVIATQPTADLVETAKMGDMEAKREIVKRATAGDTVAKQALYDFAIGAR